MLVDYGNYEPYGEGEAPPANGKGVLVSVGTDSEYVPEITKDLYDEAYQIALDRVNLTSPYKKIKRSTSSSSSSNQTKSQEAEIVYQQATAISRGDATAINDLINQDDTISNIEVVQVGPKSKRGITIFDENGKVKDFIAFEYEDEEKGIIDHDKTGFRLSKYVSSKPDVSSQQAEYDAGRKKAGKVASGKSQSRIDVPQVDDIKFEYKGSNNKKIDAIDAVYKFPSKYIKNLFKDMGVPDVSVGNIKNTSSLYTVTITDKDGKKSNHDIPKMQLDNTNYPLPNQPFNIDDVKYSIQKIIDDYYGGLAMDTTDEQIQETDVMEIDPTKYNVA